ncbi:MAG: ABC transporter ATP-binding protein [Planctomycetota bacterium]
MNGCFINLVDVELCYPSSPLRTFSIKEWAFNLARLRGSLSLVHDVLALRGVTLSVREGERLAVIGPNGAGKTTLVKAIAGIYPLRSGNIEVRGKIRSLFELGLGFEFEATGRENIMYRGLLMGAAPSAIASLQDEIVSFADLGEFIDYPVKAYSAGMLVRLAFSISTALPGEILLLDEVIAAGDASFLAKAKARLGRLISSAGILVLVSHDLSVVRELCSRAICLESGRIVADGPPAEVVDAYLRRSTQGPPA